MDRWDFPAVHLRNISQMRHIGKVPFVMEMGAFSISLAMPDIKLGSLFDGIGVFPLAASRCGIRPVWASEIEKAPISITKRHFPDMAHLGDDLETVWVDLI